MQKVIDLKGSILSLTVLSLFSDQIENTKQAIAAKIDQAPDFFVGVPVVLEPQTTLTDPTFLALLVEYLRQRQMIPIGIRTEEDVLKEQAEYAGLAVFPLEKTKKPSKQPVETSVEPPLEPESLGLKSALMVMGSVRSGQQVLAKDRDVIIMGSVNPGAEVVADGHIHVFGKVMGKVFAGASGETNAKIFAKQLAPELICIAGLYQLSEDIDAAYQKGFVEVSLQDNKLVFNTKLLG